MLKKVHQAGTTWVRAMLLGRHVPLFASWNVTFRCTRACRFCGADRISMQELDAERIIRGIRTLHSLGTRFITFSGGEPLLRDDLGILLREAKSLGMTAFISTNGDLVAERIEDVKIADRITLSLDGPEAVHDQIRGKGSFKAVMKAVETCRAHGKAAALQCTVCEPNLNHLDEILSIAKARGLNVMFQPATENLDSFDEPNPIAPTPAEHRRAVEQLMRRKRESAPVANSFAGLRHLTHWPVPTSILCGAGRYFVCVEPDGKILACHQAQTALITSGEADNAGNVNPDFGCRFRKLAIPRDCRSCWCAPLVELAMIFSLKPEAAANALRTVKC